MDNNKNNTLEKRYVLILATLSSFLTPFMGSSLNIALPLIGNEFHTNAILLGWIITSYLLTAAILLVPLGKIADIYGRKIIFTYGITIYTISVVIAGLSPSIAVLLISRVLQGIGASMLLGTSVAILSAVFQQGERGKALGINTATVYLGLSLGPFLGGLLTQYLGWRSIFFANIPICLVIIFVVWKIKEEWNAKIHGKFDFIGSFLYGLMLLCTIYGFSLLPSLKGFLLILSGLVFLILFAIQEIKFDNPILNLDLITKNRLFAYSNLATFINYCSSSATGFLMSLYLQYIKGFSPKNTGIILVLQPIIMTLFSPIAGRLSDKFEPRIISSIGMFLTALGLFIFIFIDSNTSVLFILFGLSILGTGFAFFSSPNTNAVMSSVDKNNYGIASGTIGTMRMVGQMLSISIVMLIFSLYIGRVQITPEYYNLFQKSMKISFVLFTILCFCGIFASLSRGNKNRGGSGF